MMLALLLGTVGCSRPVDKSSKSSPPIAFGAGWQALDPPAAAGSSVPVMAQTPDGGLMLAWFEPVDSLTRRLVLSRLADQGWGPVLEIARGRSLVINGAETPALLARGDHEVVACWGERAIAGEGGTRLRLARSMDQGRTWSASLTPHHDGLPVEHGFPVFASDGDQVRVLWLDARAASGPGGRVAEEGRFNMSLRAARLDREGRLSPDSLVDERTCDCCPLSAIATARGPLVAYRDRDAHEIRDIALRRADATGWRDIASPASDGWRIDGCPVNGPALASSGERVLMAWFSEAGDSARVSLASSNDAGERFGTGARVDAGAPIGRPDLALGPAGDARMAWYESRPPGLALCVRSVDAAGRPGAADTVRVLAGVRGSGRPRIGHSGGRWIVTWSEPGPNGRVHAATLADRR